MRLIFMVPEPAPMLVELAARGHEIAVVYTRAPKPAGRGMDAAAYAGGARGPRARESCRSSRRGR